MPYINERILRVALGKEKADSCIRGGRLINVFTRRIYQADVAIADGRIASVGDVSHCVGPGTIIIEANDKMLCPGFIDAHIHPEVAKLTPTQFANTALPKGTTSIVCALDQVATAAGIEGMRWVLDRMKETPFKLFHAGPSRLPYTTPSSTLSCEFGVNEHAVAQQWDEAVGTWEYLAHSIEDFEEDVLEAANMAIDNRLGLHGHAPMARGGLLDACVAAGMRSEHETANTEEFVEKIEKGLYGIMRRGTHTDNLIECVRAITEMGLPTRRMALCTDDVDCLDLVELGHMDYLVRYVINMGVDPLAVIQMATINAAEIYKIDHLVGGIAPGRYADILLVNDLRELEISAVIASGQLVAENGKMVEDLAPLEYPESFTGSVKVDRPITAADIFLKYDGQDESVKARAIQLKFIERVYRRHLLEIDLPVQNGRVHPSIEDDVLYISVTDRHSGKGITQSAFIRGFQLTRGALGTSVSPDDNNIVCIGASVEDMAVAVNRIVEMGGGQVVVDNREVVAELPLPICAVMADVSADEMAEKERELNQAAHSLGTKFKRPFFRMQFLAITGSPGYSITDQGLIDNAKRKTIEPLVVSIS